MSFEVSASRVIAADPVRTFDEMMAAPLEEIFDRRFAAMPPIEGSDGPPSWDTVGQSRTIRTADGGRMQETLTEVKRPSHFTYRIDDVKGPMKPVIVRVGGRWAFEAAGAGTRVTWTWTVHARGPLQPVIAPVFRFMFPRYGAKGLERLAQRLGD